MSSAQLTHDADRPRRRAVPIIDSRFQWKYTLLVMALGVGVMTTMGALLYRAHVDNTRLLELSDNRALQEQVIRGDQVFLLYLVLCVVAMALVLAVWGLVVTHRISGPVHLAARYLGDLADGHYPSVRPLRKGDELQAFFVAFEEAVVALKRRDQERLRELERTITQADRALEGDDPSALRDLRQSLEAQRDRLTLALGVGD